MRGSEGGKYGIRYLTLGGEPGCDGRSGKVVSVRSGRTARTSDPNYTLQNYVLVVALSGKIRHTKAHQ